MNKNDRRFRRTERMIRENFIDLMAKMPIDEITIQAITDRADINRRTFYLHYDDIYDLLNGTENYVIDHFAKMLQDFESPEDENMIGPIFFQTIMTYIADNQKMIGVLCRNPDSQLMHKLIDLTVTHGQKVIPFENTENSGYILNYCCWGMVGVLHTAMRQENFDLTGLSSLADRLLRSTLEADGINQNKV